MAYQHTLPVGTVLHDTYRIDRRLGHGGFANTYVALDQALQREVAIKEFFPNDLVVRSEGNTVHVKAPEFQKNFNWAKNRFVDEAKRLARFHHTNIVRIFDTFDENHTSYIVLEFVKGANMEDWLRGLSRPPSQAELDTLLGCLLDALQQVHNAGMLHRDVKPTNIYIREDGTPVLLDFGSARELAAKRLAGGSTHAIVSRGYSPHEAYSADSSMQGPWTDVYGLAATVYRALDSEPPPESTERVLSDAMVPAANLPDAGRYRPAFLDAIDHGLALLPKQRPQTIAAWRSELLAGADATLTMSGATLALASATIISEKSAPTSRRSSRRRSGSSAPSPITDGPPPEHLHPVKTRSATGRGRGMLRLTLGFIGICAAGWATAAWLPDGTLESINSVILGSPAPVASGIPSSGPSVSDQPSGKSEKDRERQAKLEEKERKARERQEEEERKRQAKAEEKERQERRAKEIEEEEQRNRQAKLEEKERKAKEREDEEARERQAKLEEKERKAKEREEEEERKRQARLEEKERKAKDESGEPERRVRSKQNEDEADTPRKSRATEHRPSRSTEPRQRPQATRPGGSSTVIQGIQ